MLTELILTKWKCFQARKSTKKKKSSKKHFFYFELRNSSKTFPFWILRHFRRCGKTGTANGSNPYWPLEAENVKEERRMFLVSVLLSSLPFGSDSVSSSLSSSPVSFLTSLPSSSLLVTIPSLRNSSLLLFPSLLASHFSSLPSLSFPSLLLAGLLLFFSSHCVCFCVFFSYSIFSSFDLVSFDTVCLDIHSMLQKVRRYSGASNCEFHWSTSRMPKKG